MRSPCFPVSVKGVHVTDETDVLVVTYGCYGPDRISFVAPSHRREA